MSQDAPEDRGPRGREPAAGAPESAGARGVPAAPPAPAAAKAPPAAEVPAGAAAAVDTVVPQLQGQSSLSSKVGKLGLAAVSTLYMLIRNARVHDPANAIFERPFGALRDSVNAIVSAEGNFNLQVVGTTIYLNGKQLRMDFTSMGSVKFLSEEFQRKEVGGFGVQHPVEVPELRDFIWVFSRDNDKPADEDGAPGRKLTNIKVGKFARIKEQLERDEERQIETARQVDRKKYALALYARAVYFMRAYFERMREGGMLPAMSKAGRVVQDLVDICLEQKNHFLGMTTTRNTDSYLEFHSVNTCLLAIVFGHELGLHRAQLHELGMTALFHAIGTASVPAALLAKPETLKPAERRVLALAPLHTVKTMLRARTMDVVGMRRMVAAFESAVDSKLQVRQADGTTALKELATDLGTYGKVINICSNYDALTSARAHREAYGPEVAMTLMTGDMEYKFDPRLLRIFMKVMAIQPIKVMKQGATVEIG